MTRRRIEIKTLPFTSQACQCVPDVSKLLATMAAEPNRTPHYKRSHFATQLPVDYRYSPSHCWIGRQEDDRWRVGFTKFAVRMLGDMVDHGFEIEPEAPVAAGQIIGWVEGFKAISDVFCIA